MELKTIRYDIDRRVATITLDRPHRHNAWTGRMHTEYRWVLDEAERNLKPVRCEVYGGWVFVNEDLDAIPLVEWLGPIAQEWAPLDGATCQRDTYSDCSQRGV